MDPKELEDETCDKLKVEGWTWDIVRDAQAWRESGALWRSGGVGDQPALWWRLMMRAADLLNEHASQKKSKALDDWEKAAQQ